ncbi:uncharacterized protein [Dermacentor andersoni]|uniref:uncharacterized protein isoform X1 n=1 Tax=Dermacentor andersoni TaxID=34620 RepID=UPI003B3AB299
MNIFGGGDAAQPFEVVKESSGRGRGRAKLNAQAPIMGSSCTVPQQQKPAATTPVSRGCGPPSNALPQLDAGCYWLQHSEAQRDSQMQKRQPFSQLEEESLESVNTSVSARRVGISKPALQIYRPQVVRAAEARMNVGTSDLMTSAPMTSATANGGGGVSNSSPWNAAFSKASLTDMTGCFMHSPLPSSVPAETAITQQRQQAVNDITAAEQPNSRSSQEKRDPVSTPSDRLSIIGKALTDPDSLNALQMQWLVFSICDGVTKDSNNAASAVEFCTSLIKRGRTSAFLDALVETCSEWFKRRELLLPRCTARTPAPNPGGTGRSWTAYVAFLAELLAAVSGAESSAENSGRIFSLAALLCECCHIMLRSPAQDATAEIQCLRSVFMTAGKSVQRADAQLSAALAKCLRDSFMDSSRSADVRQALLELIEFRASGWKLGAAQQRYYCAHDGGAAVTDGHSGCSGVAPLQ